MRNRWTSQLFDTLEDARAHAANLGLTDQTHVIVGVFAFGMTKPDLAQTGDSFGYWAPVMDGTTQYRIEERDLPPRKD